MLTTINHLHHLIIDISGSDILSSYFYPRAISLSGEVSEATFLIHFQLVLAMRIKT